MQDSKVDVGGFVQSKNFYQSNIYQTS